MHLLILGWSSIVRRRVLPAALAVPEIGRISIASRSRGVDGTAPAPAEGAGPIATGRTGTAVEGAAPAAAERTGDRADGAGAAAEAREVRWFPDYEQALAASGADLVYVSGVNAAHAEWVLRALEHGRHVMVDKPAFPDPRTAEAAVRLAQRRGVGLAEATVFAWHPQVPALRSLLDESDAGATRVAATFSFPPLPAGDFRYRAACGGGSLYDLGPYAAATNRLLFGTAPDRVHCAVLAREHGVDTSFSVLLTHAHGGSLTGHFGFVTAYGNRLSVLTRSRAVDAERPFTTPPDLACTLRVREGRADREITVPAADSFARFLEAFAGAVAGRDFEPFERALLDDAALVARLRRAAGLENRT